VPQIIQTIDAIARKKGRDVLYLTFYPRVAPNPDDPLDDPSVYFDHQNSLIRKEVIQWLDDNDIGWQPCGKYDPHWIILEGYCGDIYLDVPFDTENEAYQKLVAYLENPDGSMKIKDVTFWALGIEQAMTRKEQDEPGYWDRFWGDGDEAETQEKS
jgi:hypothetical protein